MRAIWSDKRNCSHSVSQKCKRIRRFSDQDWVSADTELRPHLWGIGDKVVCREKNKNGRRGDRTKIGKKKKNFSRE